MKLRKILILLGVSMLLVFAMTACDDTEDAETTEAVTEAADETVDQEEADETADQEEADASADQAAAAVDFSGIAGNWSVGGIVGPDGEAYDLDKVDSLGLDPSQLEASLSINDDGTLTYAATGQEIGGSSEFDGETLSVTFDNGYQMAFLYDSENDLIHQQNEEAKIDVIYVRAQ